MTAMKSTIEEIEDAGPRRSVKIRPKNDPRSTSEAPHFLCFCAAFTARELRRRVGSSRAVSRGSRR
jgi:hypothetical protein